MKTKDFEDIGQKLNVELKKYNYQVAPAAPSGKNGKRVKSMREYRLQFIDKQRDTSQQLIDNILDIVNRLFQGVSNVTYNLISPNSSKLPSCSFTFSGQQFDLVIGKGANKGENFEAKTVADLEQVFRTKTFNEYATLIGQLNDANEDFASVEIKSVYARKGSTKKEGVQLEKLGAVIGDIVLRDTSDNEWYISLKDINGSTFSSYPGAATLFNNAGDIQPKSAGASFLNAFGVNLSKVQEGFDERTRKNKVREDIEIQKEDSETIKNIFERAWGMNYFYVRKLSLGWKVFWLDRAYLTKLTTGIRVQEIRYPSIKSKQISIICGNSFQKYEIEIRNSAGGVYPNDIKFKVK